MCWQCSRNSLAALKRAQQEGDEWAKIYALHVKEGQHLDAQAKAEGTAKAAALQQVGKQDRSAVAGTAGWKQQGLQERQVGAVAMIATCVA
jgi:hypothetical protein